MKQIAMMIIILLAASCSKYENGPGISLISKKERAANTWEVESAYNGEENVTANYDEYTLQLLFDGDASLAALYSLGSLNFEFETQGTWKFSDDKENLVLDFENDDADRIYIINKLKEEELWIQEKGTDLELKLKPSNS